MLGVVAKGLFQMIKSTHGAIRTTALAARVSGAAVRTTLFPFSTAINGVKAAWPKMGPMINVLTTRYPALGACLTRYSDKVAKLGVESAALAAKYPKTAMIGTIAFDLAGSTWIFNELTEEEVEGTTLDQRRALGQLMNAIELCGVVADDAQATPAAMEAALENYAEMLLTAQRLGVVVAERPYNSNPDDMMPRVEVASEWYATWSGGEGGGQDDASIPRNVRRLMKRLAAATAPTSNPMLTPSPDGRDYYKDERAVAGAMSIMDDAFAGAQAPRDSVAWGSSTVKPSAEPDRVLTVRSQIADLQRAQESYDKLNRLTSMISKFGFSDNEAGLHEFKELMSELNAYTSEDMKALFDMFEPGRRRK